MATMRDVAARAGVSAKTVSRVVNNDRYVSAEVRLRVEQAIDELQYVPNMLAVTFRTGRDAAIGVAVPGVADPSSPASSAPSSARQAGGASPSSSPASAGSPPTSAGRSRQCYIAASPE